MREIKFRLRFENTIVGYEKWYSGDRVEFKAKPCWLYSTDNEYWNPNYIRHAFKDQYTGLKDNEGKEIYEDDIVEHIEEIYGMKIKERVFWVDNIAGFNPFCEYDSDCQIYVIMKTVKIIGNIHENPELWKEEK